MVKQGFSFETIFYLLNKVKLFVEKMGRNTERINDKGR